MLEIHSISRSNRWGRQMRLRGRTEINTVLRKGDSYRLGCLHAKALRSDITLSDRKCSDRKRSGGLNRYMMITSKRLGGAVERNRVRRLVREALRQANTCSGHGFGHGSGYDVCLFVNKAKGASYAVIQAEIAILTQKLLGQES